MKMVHDTNIYPFQYFYLLVACFKFIEIMFPQISYWTYSKDKQEVKFFHNKGLFLFLAWLSPTETSAQCTKCKSEMH